MIQTNNRLAVDWHAEKPFLTRPVITGTKKVGGTLHYIGEEGKMYVASLFDKMFKSIELKVKPKRRFRHRSSR